MKYNKRYKAFEPTSIALGEKRITFFICTIELIPLSLHADVRKHGPMSPPTCENRHDV